MYHFLGSAVTLLPEYIEMQQKNLNVREPIIIKTHYQKILGMENAY